MPAKKKKKKKTCSKAGCGLPHSAKGLCKKHYNQQYPKRVRPPRKRRDGLRGRSTSEQTIKDMLRAAQALTLRLAGRSYADVAAELGYANANSARTSLLRELGRRFPPDEKIEEVRNMELERLNLLLRTWMPRAVRLDAPAEAEAVAAGIVLRTIETRAALCGMGKGKDAPTVNITFTADVADSTLAQLASLAVDPAERPTRVPERPAWALPAPKEG